MKQQKENQYGDFLDNLLGDSTAEATPKEPQEGQSKERIMETLDPETQEMLKRREFQKAVQAEAIRQRQPHRTKKYVRTSFTIAPQTLAKMKELARLQNTTLKEIAMLAFEQAIERFETKHGEIVPSEKDPETLTELFK